MTDLQVCNLIRCDAETYWRCVFDEEYNRRLHLEAYKYSDYRLIDQTEDQDRIRRKFYICPRVMDLPGPLKKALSKADPSSTEEGVFDKRSGRYEVTWTPATFGSKVLMKADIWVEHRGPSEIDRVANLSVKVRMPLISWALERAIVADIERGWKLLAEFTDRFVEEKGWRK